MPASPHTYQPHFVQVPLFKVIPTSSPGTSLTPSSLNLRTLSARWCLPRTSPGSRSSSSCSSTSSTPATWTWLSHRGATSSSRSRSRFTFHQILFSLLCKNTAPKLLGNVLFGQICFVSNFKPQNMTLHISYLSDHCHHCHPKHCRQHLFQCADISALVGCHTFIPSHFHTFTNSHFHTFTSSHSRTFTLSFQCADISNPCRLWPVSRLWSLRCCEEFFRQVPFRNITITISSTINVIITAISISITIRITITITITITRVMQSENLGFRSPPSVIGELLISFSSSPHFPFPRFSSRSCFHHSILVSILMSVLDPDLILQGSIARWQSCSKASTPSSVNPFTRFVNFYIPISFTQTYLDLDLCISPIFNLWHNISKISVAQYLNISITQYPNISMAQFLYGTISQYL